MLEQAGDIRRGSRSKKRTFLDDLVTRQDFESLLQWNEICQYRGCLVLVVAMETQRRSWLGIMKTHPKNSTKLLRISASLAETAKTFWDKMTEEDKSQNKRFKSNLNQKPCGFTFSGAAYQGLQMDPSSKPALEYS
jgi:hypothetical protein